MGLVTSYEIDSLGIDHVIEFKHSKAVKGR